MWRMYLRIRIVIRTVNSLGKVHSLWQDQWIQRRTLIDRIFVVRFQLIKCNNLEYVKNCLESQEY